MNAEASELQRVVIALPPNAWHGHSTETVWADRAAVDRYRIRSIPFFATGISVNDIAAVRWEDGQAVLDRVILRGGHSTYRIFLLNLDLASEAFRVHWSPLEAMGCTYERATEHLVAIDVPPPADIQAVYKLLERGEIEKVWEFEEGHCGHSVT